MSEPTPVPVAPRGASSPASSTRSSASATSCPIPAVLFLILMLVWVLSWLLANVQLQPRSIRAAASRSAVKNLLEGTSLTAFMATMVRTFVNFPPLGVVLVAMLGLGVAEHTGFINAGAARGAVGHPEALLTPVLIAWACSATSRSTPATCW
jgi:aminobenzoyl-glutamate transport protein